MEGIKERFLAFIKHEGITKTEFERQCGLGGSYVNKIKDNIGTGVLGKIKARYPHLNQTWLIDGEGEMLSNGLSKETLNRVSDFLGWSQYNSSATEDEKALAQDYVQKLRNGKLDEAALNDMFADFVNCNSAWILRGEGDMLRTPLKNMEQVVVPFVNQYAYAGFFRGFSDASAMKQLSTILVRGDEEAKISLAIEVKGDSMDDGSKRALCDHDVLLCDDVPSSVMPMLENYINKWTFVVVHQAGVAVKKISAIDRQSGCLTLHSLNPMYQDKQIKLNDVIKLYRVIKIDRRCV